MLGSSVLCIALSHIESWCILRLVGGLHPVLLHISLYIFLKTATIPTYHNISIAVPRYIAMQLHFTLHDLLSFIIYLLLCMILYS